MSSSQKSQILMVSKKFLFLFGLVIKVKTIWSGMKLNVRPMATIPLQSKLPVIKTLWVIITSISIIFKIMAS